MNDMVSIDAGGSPIMSCTSSPEVAYINKYFVFVDFLCLFFLPLVIIVFCYTMVIRALVAPEEKIPDGGSAGTKTNPENQNKKAIKMLLVLMSLFCVCTMTPMVLNIYIMWGPGYFPSVNIVENAVYMFSYSNSWFNLIVFAYFRDDLRRGFVHLVKTSCIVRCHSRIWSRDGHLTASKRSDQEELHREKDSQRAGSEDRNPSGQQANTLIMMEF